MQLPRRRSPSRQDDDGPIPLTEEGLIHLKEKLARLKHGLPVLIAETQRTAAFGDRSDNAEYKEAKGTLRRTQWQIWTIEDQLKRVEIITSGKNIAGTIRLGSTVILDTSAGEKTFQIVGPRETDPARGRISHLSPLGAALLNHKKDNIVTIQTGTGPQKYRILEIK